LRWLLLLLHAMLLLVLLLLLKAGRLPVPHVRVIRGERPLACMMLLLLLLLLAGPGLLIRSTMLCSGPAGGSRAGKGGVGLRSPPCRTSVCLQGQHMSLTWASPGSLA
jgi:hypothetical protein